MSLATGAPSAAGTADCFTLPARRPTNIKVQGMRSNAHTSALKLSADTGRPPIHFAPILAAQMRAFGAIWGIAAESPANRRKRNNEQETYLIANRGNKRDAIFRFSAGKSRAILSPLKFKFQQHQTGSLHVSLLNRAFLISLPLAIVSVAAVLVLDTGFALRCGIQRHRMRTVLLLETQRRDACRALKWRWEADDQQHQYRAGSSAGMRTTVGPIAGYVMDVAENDAGHAVGYCHSTHATYQDLAAGF